MPQQLQTENQTIGDIGLIEEPSSHDSGIKTKSYEAEENTFLKGKSYADVEREQRIRHGDDLHKLRQQILPRLFYLAIGWLVFVISVILSQGIHYSFFCNFHLSDAVIIALLTTSTATVLGMFGIAANWLFPKK